MYCFKDIAFSIFLLGTPHDIVSQVEIHFFRGYFESFDVQIDLLPTPESLLDFYSKTYWFILFLFFPKLHANFTLFAFNESFTFLSFAVCSLNIDCDLDGLLVQSDLLIESEGAKGILEVVVYHEFGFFSIAKRHQSKSLDLASDFVVHKHDQFLKHQRHVD